MLCLLLVSAKPCGSPRGSNVQPRCVWQEWGGSILTLFKCENSTANDPATPRRILEEKGCVLCKHDCSLVRNQECVS